MASILQLTQLKLRRSSLQTALKDLSDDSGDVSKLNRQLTELSHQCADLIRCSASQTIASRLDHLREPSQDADSDLRNARYYLQLELSALEKEITQVQQALAGS